MRKLKLVLLSGLIFLSSCLFMGGERVNGSGQVTTQQRPVSDFSSVHVSGSINVQVDQNTTASVKVEADDNLLPFIEVYTEGSNLIVREKKGYNLHPTKDIIVYVSAPVFKGIRVSGSGGIVSGNTITQSEALDVHVSGSGDIKMQIDLPKMSSSVSGSGSVALKGHATDLELNVSGSGKIRCFELNSDNVTLGISGSGDANVTANKKLDARVSGSGNITYKGNASVSQRVSGSGEIRKVD